MWNNVSETLFQYCFSIAQHAITLESHNGHSEVQFPSKAGRSRQSINPDDQLNQKTAMIAINEWANVGQ